MAFEDEGFGEDAHAGWPLAAEFADRDREINGSLMTHMVEIERHETQNAGGLTATAVVLLQRLT